MGTFTARNDNDIPVLTKVVIPRRDIVKLCTVEIAINLKDTLGVQEAAEFLKRHEVDIDVALRVLLRPSQRRFSI